MITLKLLWPLILIGVVGFPMIVWIIGRAHKTESSSASLFLAKYSVALACGPLLGTFLLFAGLTGPSGTLGDIVFWGASLMGFVAVPIAVLSLTCFINERRAGARPAQPQENDQSQKNLPDGIWVSAALGLSVLIPTIAGLILYAFARSVGHGRPLRRGRGTIAARTGRNGYWSRSEASPRIHGLDESQRRKLAAAWLSDALAEHSSVATFSHLALELMREGAPAELIAGCHQAALDEIRHAQTAFSFSSLFGGHAVGAGSFPGVDRAYPMRFFSTRAGRLRRIALDSLVDGCLGEAVGARLLLEGAGRAQDSAVQSALEVMAGEERSHAELAWRIVAWCFEGLSRRDRDIVMRTFEVRSAFRRADRMNAPAVDLFLLDWGRPDPSRQVVFNAIVLTEVRERLLNLDPAVVSSLRS